MLTEAKGLEYLGGKFVGGLVKRIKRFMKFVVNLGNCYFVTFTKSNWILLVYLLNVFEKRLK